MPAALLALALACALAGPASASADGARAGSLAALAWTLDGDGPMGLASAWARPAGEPATVAVLDTGADLTHPALAPALWVNPGEVPGNGVDDDRDGFVDDVHGADLVNRDGDPADDNGHGTHVAGIVGAVDVEETGVSGVAPGVRLMIVKVLDRRARGRDAAIARGVRYAVAHGARVVNLSLALRHRSSRVRAALRRAAAAGALVVTAAGNRGADLRRRPAYPASYGLGNVVGVAATDQAGPLAPFSDFGRGVPLAAPGVDIVSTAWGGGDELRSGTSMAAPMAAGAAALVAAAHPGARWRELRRALVAGARPGDGLPSPSRRLDAAGALDAAR